MLGFGKKSAAIKKARTCEGWTSEDKLALLWDLAGKVEGVEGDILEIGSAWGRSTVLLGHASGKKIWSIDPHTGGLIYISKGQPQNSYDGFVGNLEKFGLRDRVEILKHTTQEVIDANLLPQDHAFAMAFIDGLHTADGVAVDFPFAFSRLSKGGVIIFDDYFEATVADYKEKIDELAAEAGLSLVKEPKVGLAYAIRS